jgi:hypothetical protein
MSLSVDLYGTAYGNFAAEVLAQVRRDTYGEDFGQSIWVTGPEYRRFFPLLGLAADDHVLDVGCGSGGPAWATGSTSAGPTSASRRGQARFCSP